MYFLGIDPGGTKCEAVLCDENANIIGFGRYTFADIKGANPYETDSRGRGGLGRSKEAILGSVKQAIAGVEDTSSMYVCAAKYSEQIKSFFNEAHIKYGNIYTTNEAQAIMSAAGLDYAYIALAGTGAFTYYYTPDEEFYFDGLGPNLGDFGGGCYIGHKGIKAAAISEWSSEYNTSIATKVNLKYLNKTTNNLGADLVPIFFELPDRSEIASVAVIVDEEATKGDPIAIDILKDAGRAIANTVRCLATNIRPYKEKLPIVCSGSVITKSKYYKESFIQAINEFLPGYEIIFLDIPQAYGQMICAVKKYNQIDVKEFYNNLMNNLKK